MRLGRFFRLTGITLLLALTPALAQPPSDLDRTWSQGKLTWSQDGHVETGGLAASLGDVAKALAGRKSPAVVYLHGCSGLDNVSTATAAFLAEAGYVVASPDSFARTNKPVSCNVATHTSSLHRGVLAWRQAEAAKAVSELRRLPFVDSGRIYLFGFSEGAIAAATVTGVTVRARIIEGWSCHAGWPEYVGFRAPASQPALTLTSASDPWFQTEGARGDCSDFMRGRFGSRSVVFRPPNPLSAEHYVSGNPEVQATILQFMRSR